MKRNVKIGLILLLLVLIPAGLLTAQEKKNEQRVKIINADKSGTKVEIDTLISNGTMTDSILLKNGEVIYLGHHKATGKIAQKKGDQKHMIVTVVSDEKDGEKIEKDITVISGDSVRVIGGTRGNEVIIVKGGKHITEGKKGKIVSWSSSEGNSKSGSYIYINKDSKSGSKGEQTYSVTVTSDENEKDSKVEKTKYVIAKDGMVVTIEGDDEAKAKELLNEIQTKLDINKENKTEKKVVKTEKKTTIKE
jgi:hypothetical protein